MKKKLIISVCLVVLLALIALGGYQYYKRTPAYALSTIQTSTEKHDYDSFSKFVDVDNVLSLAYDNIIDAYMGGKQQKRDEMFDFMTGFAIAMKNDIVASAADDLESYIKTGKHKRAGGLSGTQAKIQQAALRGGLDVQGTGNCPKR